MIKSNFHEPVLVNEVIGALELNAHLNKICIIDATVGTGGHLLELVKQKVEVLGIDQDPKMLEIAEERLKACPILEDSRGSFKLIHGNFKDIDQIAKENNFTGVTGILFDLGVSNLHLKASDRGFSFANPETGLDMRLDSQTQAVTGADLLNILRKDQLQDLFGKILNGFESRKITKRILDYRKTRKIQTVGDFLEICRVVKSKPGLSQGTLPFLALRIAVNSELDNLVEALPKAFELMTKGGRLLVISFHSAEDIIVKRFFEKMSKENLGKIITEKPIIADQEEVFANQKSRSAKLRILEKI